MLSAICLLGHAHAANMATTKVVRVERSNGEVTGVVLAAGRVDGVVLDTHVTLLRDGDPIVHPLTGEPLGTPQEPVGVIMVYEVSDRQSKGVMVKTYSEPAAGDLAEYERTVAPMPRAKEPEPKAIVAMAERVENLEKSVQKYGKSNRALQRLPGMSQQVLDEIGAMKSYLVGLDERLVELEERQDEDQNRLASIIRGEYSSEDMKELTIRYAADTNLRLRVAGKTLIIGVEKDSVFIEEPVTQFSLADESLEEDMEEDSRPIMERLESFMQTPYGIGTGIGLFIIIAGAISWLIKRRYDNVMQGIDDWEDEYTDDDEEEDI